MNRLTIKNAIQAAALAAISILLALIAPPDSAGHPGGRYIRVATLEATLTRHPQIGIAICRGRGRPLRPAPAPFRRYKHFSCQRYTVTADILCSHIHIARNGRVIFGRIYDGYDPATPPAACGA